LTFSAVACFLVLINTTANPRQTTAKMMTPIKFFIRPVSLPSVAGLGKHLKNFGRDIFWNFCRRIDDERGIRNSEQKTEIGCAGIARRRIRIAQ